MRWGSCHAGRFDAGNGCAICCSSAWGAQPCRRDWRPAQATNPALIPNCQDEEEDLDFDESDSEDDELLDELLAAKGT